MDLPRRRKTYPKYWSDLPRIKEIYPENDMDLPREAMKSSPKWVSGGTGKVSGYAGVDSWRYEVGVGEYGVGLR